MNKGMDPAMVTTAELPIDTTATAEQMASSIFGAGMKVETATYTGAQSASGIYSNGLAVAPDLTPTNGGVILSTGNATDVTNTSGAANQSASTGTNLSQAGDSDLDAIANATTYDAAVLEVEFVPDGDILTMQFVFGSEEYLEYVNSGFNDAFGVFVNGEKLDITFGTGDVTINNINNQINQNLYVDNPQSGAVVNTEMDGITVSLTLKAPVKVGEINKIKFAIADGGDGIYDSNVLIGEGSVQSSLIANDDSFNASTKGTSEFDLVANDMHAGSGKLFITEINGQPVVAGQAIELPNGDKITPNGDGTITFESGGSEGENVFSYKVQNEDGSSDIAFVTVTTTVPCFVSGTLIDTPDGRVPVEDIRVGDQVTTYNNGPQVVRWAGTAERYAVGCDAPVRITSGRYGAHETVEVSQNHRVLVSNAQAELYFGDPEVLVLAKDLVDDHSVHVRADGSKVTYVHLLFDDHEIISSNGFLSESYHPGAETLGNFSDETRAELFRMMPDLQTRVETGEFPAARRALKRHEAAVLLAR